MPGPGSSAKSVEQQQCDSAVAATLFLFAVVLPPIRYGKFIYPERIAQYSYEVQGELERWPIPSV